MKNSVNLSPRVAVASAALFFMALTSLAYAAMTAPQHAQDLRVFQLGAQEWLARTYTIGAGPIFLHPPFAVPLLAPLAWVSFDHLVYIWLLLNLVATAVTVYAAIRLLAPELETGWRLYLLAFLLCWAPFRVTLRVGQMSLMITALLLYAFLARQSRRRILAGVLLGLSLSKYSMTLPFVLYLLWKREWKIVGTTLITIGLLTEVFALWLGMPLVTMVQDYVRAVALQTAGAAGFTGTTEIKMLVFGLTGNESLTLALTLVLVITALVAMFIAFRRSRELEDAHLAILSFFALWFSYHRTYDSVLCIVPATVFVGFLRTEKLKTFGWIGLGGLALLVLSVPGLLVDRCHLDPTQLTTNPLGFIGFHIERLLVFTFFCGLLWLLWRRNFDDEKSELTPISASRQAQRAEG